MDENIRKKLQHYLERTKFGHNKIKKGKFSKISSLSINKSNITTKSTVKNINSVVGLRPTKIIKENLKKYNITLDEFQKNIAMNLILSKVSHLNSYFKDILKFDDFKENLRRYYTKIESKQRIPTYISYYKNYARFYCRPILSDLTINGLIQDKNERKAQIYYDSNLNVSPDKKIKKDNEEINIFSSTIEKLINDTNSMNNLTISDKMEDREENDISQLSYKKLLNTINNKKTKKSKRMIGIDEISINRLYNKINEKERKKNKSGQPKKRKKKLEKESYKSIEIKPMVNALKTISALSKRHSPKIINVKNYMGSKITLTAKHSENKKRFIKLTESNHKNVGAKRINEINQITTVFPYKSSKNLYFLTVSNWNYNFLKKPNVHNVINVRRNYNKTIFNDNNLLDFCNPHLNYNSYKKLLKLPKKNKSTSRAKIK